MNTPPPDETRERMTTDDQLAEDVRGVLEGAGLTDRPEEYGDGIHGWRCEYPDRYGRCDCLPDLRDDLIHLIREREAAAWDEGEASVELTDEDRRVELAYAGYNPYRQETDHAE